MAKDHQSYRLSARLSHWKEMWIFFWSETGTDTCVLSWQLLVRDNFPPPATTINDPLTFGFMPLHCELRDYFIFFCMCSERDPLWDFNYPAHISNARHSYCEFGTLFLFSCSFVSFKPPRRLQKEGKQKHLFTPLLSRGDLEGGSVLSTGILFKWAMIHTSPQPIGSGLCLCACL